MYSLLTEQLAEQRRQELLREAERARLAAGAHSAAPRAAGRGPLLSRWRTVAGLALVRIGVRLGGDALADAVVVVPGRGARPATLAVVWRGRDNGPSRRAGTGRSNGRPGRPPVLSRR